MADLRGGTTIAGYRVWHAGNMGPNSNLNADLLDGLHASSFGQLTINNTWTGTNTFNDVTISSGKTLTITGSTIAAGTGATLTGTFAGNPIWSGSHTFQSAITLNYTPTNATDAVTKAYVDALKQGLDLKESVRAATTTNITLSGIQTIDGVTLIAGDRVLVKDQTSAKENGIYVVASGTWTRAVDADTNAKVTAGMYTFVTEGTTNNDTGWVLITNDQITLDTTALSFSQFSGTGLITVDSTLTKNGNQLKINLGNSNTWTALQTFNAGLTIASGQTLTATGATITGTSGSKVTISYANIDATSAVNDSALTSNIARLNTAQTWTAAQTYGVTGTATSTTQGYYSHSITLRGSGWTGSAAANTDMVIRNTTVNSTNYKLSVLVNSVEIASINQAGDITGNNLMVAGDINILKTLNLPSSPINGGQISSTGIIKFGNGSNAQGIYAKQIAATDGWSDGDTYTPTNGIYSKGNLRVGGATNALFVDATNSRVGIGGITSPSYTLHSNGSAYITSYTGIGVNPDSTVAMLQITTDAASRPVLVTRAAASQTANIQEWRKNDNTVLTYIDGAGYFQTTTGIRINAAGPNAVSAIIKAATSQTANMTEWQDNSGNVKAKVNNIGEVTAPSYTTGDFRIQQGSSGGLEFLYVGV